MKNLTIGRLRKLAIEDASLNHILSFVPAISKAINILKELDEIDNNIEKQTDWLGLHYEFYIKTLLIFQVDYNDWSDYKCDSLIKVDKNYTTPKLPFKPLLDLFEIYTKIDYELAPTKPINRNKQKEYYDQD